MLAYWLHDCVNVYNVEELDQGAAHAQWLEDK